MPWAVTTATLTGKTKTRPMLQDLVLVVWATVLLLFALAVVINFYLKRRK